MRVPYRCQNPACDVITSVQEWPATRYDPADSTWGDGCEGCGEELQHEPVSPDELPEPDYEAIEEQRAMRRTEGLEYR
jgi:hypothetical protein